MFLYIFQIIVIPSPCSRHNDFQYLSHMQRNLVPRAMPVRGLGLALALGKRNEIRNFIGCREIKNLGAA